MMCNRTRSVACTERAAIRGGLREINGAKSGVLKSSAGAGAVPGMRATVTPPQRSGKA
jgi:hypothetical protein